MGAGRKCSQLIYLTLSFVFLSIQQKIRDRESHMAWVRRKSLESLHLFLFSMKLNVFLHLIYSNRVVVVFFCCCSSNAPPLFSQASYKYVEISHFFFSFMSASLLWLSCIKLSDQGPQRHSQPCLIRLGVYATHHQSRQLSSGTFGKQYVKKRRRKGIYFFASTWLKLNEKTRHFLIHQLLMLTIFCSAHNLCFLAAQM